jgi:hypothetical protein
VRQLSDPNWKRDPAWVLDRISWAKRFAETAELQSLLDVAEQRTRAYARAGRPVWKDDQTARERRDAQWDEVLEAIDTFLIALQAKHLPEVDQAGFSGRAASR